MRYEDGFPNFDKTRDLAAGDFVIVNDPKIPRTKR
jgi:hypothetical protein